MPDGLPPLKVLLVCEDIPAVALGGLGKHVVALGNALINAGHAVTLMGRDAPTFTDCAHEVGFNGPFIAGFGNPFPGWKEKQLGVAWPAKRPQVARLIAQAVQRHATDFDVVHYHGHHPMVGRYLPPGLNFLQTRHDQGSDCITHTRFRDGQVCNALQPEACATCMHPAPGPLRTAITAAAVRRYRRETADAFERHPVVFVSDFLLRNARRTLPAAALAQAQVLHNFCDEKALFALRGGASDNQPFTVHLAGRLEPAKGMLALLRLLAPRLPGHWRVNLFGDGPDRAEIARLVAPLPVVLHGHAPLGAALQTAAHADLVVVPSLCEESCSTVILEALRLGKPCLALQRGGTPELARYGASGQLRLFVDLVALVDHLLAWPGAGPAGGEPADVSARLPQILALYRRRHASAGGA